MSFQKVVAGLAVILFASASVALADTYTLSADVSNVYSAGFGSQPLTGGGPYPAAFAPTSAYQQNAVATGAIYQIDFYGSYAGNNRCFGLLDWNIGGVNYNGAQDATHLGNSDLAGWQPDSSNTDTNGATPSGGQPLWFVNADGGAQDLQHILQTVAVVAAPSAFDFRAKLGITAASTANSASVTQDVNATGWATGTVQNRTYLGSVYVNWNGTGSFDVTGTLNAGSAYVNAADGTLVQDATPTFVNADVHFGVAAPEPASMLLLGLGGLGLVGFARRRS